MSQYAKMKGTVQVVCPTPLLITIMNWFAITDEAIDNLHIASVASLFDHPDCIEAQL
ncbi:hypothetical protein T08_1642 [Trichinella sp. T8]|nr:hypothetical protein T08_1642 [Trichinella sp. T8]